MKRFFPIMNDDADKGMHFALLAYWIFAFGVIPTWMPLFGDGFLDDLPVISWLEIACHVLNSVVVIIMLKTYLADSFLNVQIEPKKFLCTVVVSALVMLALAAGLHFVYGYAAMDYYPISEMNIAFTTGAMVQAQPVFGTICCSLFVPFTVVGLFYATGFAPVCRRNPWLGYLTVAVVLAIPQAMEVLWRGISDFALWTYFLQLPIHWVACWSYQKADTIWAPITTLALFNLGASLLGVLQFYF